MTQFESGQGDRASSSPFEPVFHVDSIRPPDPGTRSVPPSGGVSAVLSGGPFDDRSSRTGLTPREVEEQRTSLIVSITY